MIDDIWAYHSALAEVHIATAELIRRIVTTRVTWLSTSSIECVPNATEREEASALLAIWETAKPSPHVLVLLHRAFQILSLGRGSLCGRYNSEHEYVAARTWGLLLEGAGQRIGTGSHDDVVMEERLAEQVELMLQEANVAETLREPVPSVTAAMEMPPAVTAKCAAEDETNRWRLLQHTRDGRNDFPNGPVGETHWRVDDELIPVKRMCQPKQRKLAKILLNRLGEEPVAEIALEDAMRSLNSDTKESVKKQVYLLETFLVQAKLPYRCNVPYGSNYIFMHRNETGTNTER